MKTLKKDLTKLICLVLLVSSVVYILLSLAYSFISSNIVYSSTFIPTATEQIILLFNLVTYAVCFAIFIYSICHLGVKASIHLLLIYSGVLLIRPLIDKTLYYIIFNGAWTLEVLIYVLILWFFEMLLALAVVLISYLCSKSNAPDELDFNKLYSKENPLHRSALFCAIVISLLEIIPRIIDDIAIGAPTGISDVLWILAMYSSNIISGMIVYIISIFLIKKLHNRYSA